MRDQYFSVNGNYEHGIRISYILILPIDPRLLVSQRDCIPHRLANINRRRRIHGEIDIRKERQKEYGESEDTKGTFGRQVNFESAFLRTFNMTGRFRTRGS